MRREAELTLDDAAAPASVALGTLDEDVELLGADEEAMLKVEDGARDVEFEDEEEDKGAFVVVAFELADADLRDLRRVGEYCPRQRLFSPTKGNRSDWLMRT